MDVDIHIKAIDRCRTAIRTASGSFEDLKDDLKAPIPPDRTPTGASTDSTAFGTLDGAGDLAKLVDKVWETAGGELADAHQKLKLVERALDDVQNNVKAANKATS